MTAALLSDKASDAKYALLWWWDGLSPRSRIGFRCLLAAWCSMLFMFLLAPKASATATGELLRWTGIPDSKGINLGDYTLVFPSDDFFEWNGVLPSFHPGGLGNALTNGVLALECGLLLIIVCFGLWLIIVMYARFWFLLFLHIFTTINGSLWETLNTIPARSTAVVVGLTVGVVLVAIGRATQGRATLVTTVLVGFIVYRHSHGAFKDVTGEHGTLRRVEKIAAGASGQIMNEGKATGTSGGGWLDGLYGAVVDTLVRGPVQIWNFGRVLDASTAKNGRPVNAADFACATTWDDYLRSSGQKQYADKMLRVCPDDVKDAIANTPIMPGLVMCVLAALCLAFGVACAWRGLNCRFRVFFFVGFAPAIAAYGTFPGWPRRYLRLSAEDAVVQALSDGVYIVLTGVYALLMALMFKAPIEQWTDDSAMGQTVKDFGPIFRLVIAAMVIVLFYAAVKHHQKLHREAMGHPASSGTGMGKVAAASVAGGLAARNAFSSPAGGGGRSAGRSSNGGRLDTAWRATEMMLSRSNPAMSTAGALLGSAAGDWRSRRRSLGAEEKNAQYERSESGSRPAGRPDKGDASRPSGQRGRGASAASFNQSSTDAKSPMQLAGTALRQHFQSLRETQWGAPARDNMRPRGAAQPPAGAPARPSSRPLRPSGQQR